MVFNHTLSFLKAKYHLFRTRAFQRKADPKTINRLYVCLAFPSDCLALEAREAASLTWVVFFHLGTAYSQLFSSFSLSFVEQSFSLPPIFLITRLPNLAKKQCNWTGTTGPLHWKHSSQCLLGGCLIITTASTSYLFFSNSP